MDKQKLFDSLRSPSLSSSQKRKLYRGISRSPRVRSRSTDGDRKSSSEYWKKAQFKREYDESQSQIDQMEGLPVDALKSNQDMHPLATHSYPAHQF